MLELLLWGELMEGTIQELRKVMIESMELGRGCQRLQMSSMIEAGFQVVFLV